MSKKNENRGRKPLPPGQKKPPQPTIKINEALYPFVKLLKREYKAKRVDTEKLNALTKLLLEDALDLPIEKSAPGIPDESVKDKKKLDKS